MKAFKTRWSFAIRNLTRLGDTIFPTGLSRRKPQDVKLKVLSFYIFIFFQTRTCYNTAHDNANTFRGRVMRVDLII